MTAEQAFAAGAARRHAGPAFPQAPAAGAGPGAAPLRTRGAALALLAAALCAGLFAPVADAAELTGLTLNAQGGGAQLVLSMSGGTDAHLFHLSAPDRTVLDLEDTQLAPGVAGPHAAGIVQAVRVGHQPGGVLRVVLDLSGPYPAHAAWTSGPRGRQLVLTVGAAAVAGAQSAPAAPASTQEPTGPASAASSSAAPSSAAAAAQPVVTPLAEESASAAPAADPGPHAVRPSHAPSGEERDIVVAVDAGHGGLDPGAIGHGGTREKDVTLGIAALLAARINREPGMRAILTRSRDEFVVLRDRTLRARAAKADMFVSVHADAARNREASGASVYVLSEKGASSENARWLAERENAADLMGGVKLVNKDPTLASVLLDLTSTATISSSIEAAERVLACLDGVEEVRRSQVQQAGFVVLKSLDIPSMLVETAYISNPDDEARLRSQSEQQRLADAIFLGVRRYFLTSPPAGTRFAALAHAEAVHAGSP